MERTEAEGVGSVPEGTDFGRNGGTLANLIPDNKEKERWGNNAVLIFVGRYALPVLVNGLGQDGRTGV